MSQNYTSTPDEQPTRWHLWFDGREIISMICEGGGPKRTWSEGPRVTVQNFTTGEGLTEAAIGILNGSQGKKVKGLGIIVHVADCPSLNPVIESYDDLEKFPEAAKLAVDNPKAVILAGDSLGASRLRAFPVVGAKSNKIVLFRLANNDLEGLAQLCEIDAPISVTVRCAQAEAITVTQRLVEGIILEGEEDDTAPYARFIILYYRKSTILALYDEKGFLTNLRHLPHQESKISSQMATEYAMLLKQVSVGVKNVRVTVFDFGDNAAAVEEALQVKGGTSSLDITMQSMPMSLMPDLLNSMGIEITIPSTASFPAECVMEYDTFLLAGTTGGSRKNINFMLKAAKDNYLDESTELRKSVVGLADMRTMLFARYSRRLAIAATIAVVGFLGLKTYNVLNSPYWKADPADFQKSSEQLAALEAERTEFKQLEGILEPKGELWQNLELLLTLFPESRDLALTEARFSEEQQTGVQKWAINGYANDIGLETLRALQNPETLEAAFAKVAENTKAWSLLPGDGKTRRLSVREEKNASFSAGSNGNSVTDKYPMRFTVDITYTGGLYTPPAEL